MPWLEPDIVDHLAAVRARGVDEVVISPIGFVSDHLEVLYDLDVEARDAAAELGLRLVRASSASTHPAFVAMIRELVEERLVARRAAASGRPLRARATTCVPSTAACPAPGARAPGRARQTVA